MVSGAFAKMVHDHEFFEHPDGTLMTDRFMFSSPFGIIGRIVDFRSPFDLPSAFDIRHSDFPVTLPPAR